MALNVFYVDDESDLCELFQETFENKDTLIKTFCNPNDALEAAKSTRPDVIFLDFRLANTTGEKLAFLFERSIPKYLVTGEMTVSVNYPFEGIIHKPYKSLEIRKVLDSHRN